MLLKVQEALPDACVEAFAANADLTAQPEVRKRNVYGTSSVQVNISAAGLTASGQSIELTFQLNTLNDADVWNWQIIDWQTSWAISVVSITMAVIVQTTLPPCSPILTFRITTSQEPFTCCTLERSWF